MLDRLISGAGAVTDGADRSVRLLASGPRGGFATRPGSVLVAVLLFILAGTLVLAGLEATDPPTPVQLEPSAVARTRDLGNRTYATMQGSISSAYVVTFEDTNGNSIEDSGENGVAWYYWLVDAASRTGVTVRSTRPPETVFEFRGSGTLIREPNYPREAYPGYADEASRVGLEIEPGVVLDTTNGQAGLGTVVDLAAPLPTAGTLVEVSGARLGSYVGVCRHDIDLHKGCEPAEADMYEVLVFDPATRQAIRVFVAEVPEFTAGATITGQLRREERAVDDAMSNAGLDLRDLGLAVSDRYILDDGAAPGSATLAFGLAGVLAALGGIILVGLAGGYLIYRRSDGALPVPATTMAPGERLPLRISGLVRTPTGLEHVREVPGELVRFVLGRQIAPPELAGPTEVEAPGPAGPTELPEPGGGSQPPDGSEVATTLIVERVGLQQGVALGLGELERVSAGQVMALGGLRPGARVVAGTGPLVLSFDTEADRDRAVAELLDETGLGPDGKRSHDRVRGARWTPGSTPTSRPPAPRRARAIRSSCGSLTCRPGSTCSNAGASDPQSPHTEDELYYVVAGRAIVTVGDGDPSGRARLAGLRRGRGTAPLPRHRGTPGAARRVRPRRGRPRLMPSSGGSRLLLHSSAAASSGPRPTSSWRKNAKASSPAARNGSSRAAHAASSSSV